MDYFLVIAYQPRAITSLDIPLSVCVLFSTGKIPNTQSQSGFSASHSGSGWALFVARCTLQRIQSSNVCVCVNIVASMWTYDGYPDYIKTTFQPHWFVGNQRNYGCGDPRDGMGMWQQVSSTHASFLEFLDLWTLENFQIDLRSPKSLEIQLKSFLLPIEFLWTCSL